MDANKDKNSAAENRHEVAQMLVQLEEQIQTLRVEFEQYFSGVIPFQPEKLKAEVERNFRSLLKAPLKNSELNFRAKALKYRYNTLDTYWRRVLREREEGRYHKDLFKAAHRLKKAEHSQRLKSREGKLEQQIRSIYQVYTRCLDDAGYASSAVSYDAFKSALTTRVAAFKQTNPGKKVRFSVVVKDGQPSVEASVKE